MATPLTIEPLTKESFAPYGDVIEASGEADFMINDGAAGRFHALCKVDAGVSGGTPAISIFRATRPAWPVQLTLLERHPLGSQAFMPLSNHDWLAVVADPVAKPSINNIRIFRARGSQGVQYARGTWHHPLVILEPAQDFLVVDRCVFGDGDTNNLEEYPLPGNGITLEIEP